MDVSEVTQNLSGGSETVERWERSLSVGEAIAFGCGFTLSQRGDGGDMFVRTGHHAVNLHDNGLMPTP